MTRLRSVVLTIGAVLGTVCLLVAIAGALMGVKALVFRSGSMGPDIPAGSVGFTRPATAADLKVGDVVSVVNAKSTRVTHRIVGINGSGDSRALTLQGDANPSPDAETYQVSKVDRVFFSVPAAGYVVNWLGSPIGLFVLGGAAVGILVLGFTAKPKPRPGRRRAVASVAAPAVATALVLSGATGTMAQFTDTAPITGTTVTAHTMVSQTQPTCTDKGGLLGLLGYSEIAWTHVDDRYEYAWTAVRLSNGTTTGTGVVTPTVPAGSTVTLKFETALLSLALAGQNYDVIIQARLKNAPLWTATTITTTRIHTVNLLVGLSVRCGNV